MRVENMYEEELFILECCFRDTNKETEEVFKTFHHIYSL